MPRARRIEAKGGDKHATTLVASRLKNLNTEVEVEWPILFTKNHNFPDRVSKSHPDRTASIQLPPTAHGVLVAESREPLSPRLSS